MLNLSQLEVVYVALKPAAGRSVEFALLATGSAAYTTVSSTL